MRKFILVFGIAAAGLTFTDTVVRAQQAQPGTETVLMGVLTAIWGDPRAEDPQPTAPRLILHLTDAQGRTTPLQMTESVLQAAGGLRALNGRQVVITAVVADANRTTGETPVVVRSIRLATANEVTSVASEFPERLTGPQPRAVILCRFGDSTGTTPHAPSFFTGLMNGASSPALDHFWSEVSYGNINLNGTAVYGWYNLPMPRSYYVYDTNADGIVDLDFTRTVADCTAAADADVFFPSFTAIDLNFNQDLDCCAWGGRQTITIDGTTRTYGVTWMPPWSQNTAVYAHESGHSLGFPHSSGPYANTYDSQWDPMSSPGNTCRVSDPVYGCVPVHTIMHHKDLDAWIPASRRFDTPPNSQTSITLSRSAQPGGTGYLFAKIPIGGSTNNFYTVELRRFAGYDNGVPSEAVLLHNVLTTRSDRDAQVVDPDNDGDPNDSGAMWTAGETFNDPANSISVEVLSITGSTATVTIRLGTTVSTENDRDGDGKADLAIFRPSTGTWFIANSTTGYTTNTARQWGLSTDLPVPGDYDGDGRMDLAVYRPSHGTWYILQSSTDSLRTHVLGLSSDLPVPADYDGDGKIDPAVYRPSTAVWYILPSIANYSPAVTFQWGIPGDIPVPGDYDGDEWADLTVYRPSTSEWYVLKSSSGATESSEFHWGFKGDVPVPGDYDGDATTDVAVYRPSTGTWYVLRSSTNFTTSISFQWGLAGDIPVPSDYDGDLKTDLAVYRPSSGTWHIAHSTSSYVTSSSFQWGLSGDTPVPQSSLAYALAGRSTLATLARASDFDGDRRSDLTVFRPSNATWFSLRSSEGFGVFSIVPWGQAGDTPMPHDFDGDGQTDFTVYRPSTGVWRSLLSTTGYTASTTRQWGLAGDLPVPGDYDGDTIADPAVFRPATGVWHILLSTTNYTTSAAFQWGLPGDMPVPGDYDGDVVTDIAVYRPSTGVWFIRHSSAGYATGTSSQWGLPDDIPVPGEYDGDGKTDVAVYRPSTGAWYLLQSSTNYTTSAQHQWGLSDDTPVPGDYDGDRKTDLAVWRPSTGVWHLLKSSSGFTTFDAKQWGLSGDIPILKRP